MGNGWMSPLDQGKYASYLFFHGLLDKAQYQQLDEIGEQLNTVYFCGLWSLIVNHFGSISHCVYIIAAIPKKNCTNRWADPQHDRTTEVA